MAAVQQRGSAFGGGAWNPGSYGTLYAHFYNHYLKYGSQPFVHPKESSAERDAARAIKYYVDSGAITALRQRISENFSRKLRARGRVYMTTILNCIREESASSCLRRATEKAFGAFGRDRVINVDRLSPDARRTVADFIERYRKQYVMDSKKPGVIQWNSYPTQAVRIAEKNLMDLGAEYANKQIDVKNMVKLMREAAVQALSDEIMIEVRNDAADAGRSLFEFMRDCKQMEDFEERYKNFVVHPLERVYPNRNGAFWRFISDSNWPQERSLWYKHIDDAEAPGWWDEMASPWYTAKELEAWCDTYKLYATRHDPRWERLYDALGQHEDHSEWMQRITNQDYDKLFKVKEWQNYTAAGLKFFMLDLLVAYRNRANQINAAGSEIASRAQDIEKRNAAREEQRRRLAAAAEARTFERQTQKRLNERRKQLIDRAKASETAILTSLEAHDADALKHNLDLFEACFADANVFLKTHADDPAVKKLQAHIQEVRDVYAIKAEFAQFDMWEGDKINLWRDSTKSVEQGTLKFSANTPFIDSNLAPEIEIPTDVLDIIDNTETQKNTYEAIALQNQMREQARRAQEAREAAEKKRSEEKSRSDEIENLIETYASIDSDFINAVEPDNNIFADEDLPLTPEDVRLLSKISEENDDDANGDAEQDDAFDSLFQNDDVSENKEQDDEVEAFFEEVTQRKTATRAQEVLTAKQVLEEMSKLEMNSAIATALNTWAEQLDKAALAANTDDVARMVSKNRKIARKVNAEQAARALKKKKQTLETTWLPSLQLTSFAHHEAMNNRESSDYKTWSEQIWPLIQQDMRKSFEITDWKKMVLNTLKRKGITTLTNEELLRGNWAESLSETKLVQLNKAFDRKMKNRYSKKSDHGIWYTLRTQSGELIATAWADECGGVGEPGGPRAPSPELYALKVKSDYESLGVGRYLSYLVFSELFLDTTSKGIAARALMPDIDWRKAPGIVLTPSTKGEQNVYENWKNADAATYEKYDPGDKTIKKSTIVTPAKHDEDTGASSNSNGSAATPVSSSSILATPILRAAPRVSSFPSSHPLHAAHASVTSAIQAHIHMASKLYSQKALWQRAQARAYRRRHFMGLTKVYPGRFSVPSPAQAQPAAVIAAPSKSVVAAHRICVADADASQGAPPSPPRGMLRD